MPRQVITRLIVSIMLIITLIGLSSPIGQPAAVAQEGENLLQNPGFEGEFVAIDGDSTLRVASGWQPWSLPPPPGAGGSVNLRPDYQPAPANRVNSGSAAQQYDTFFATHVGGVYQRVPVDTGDIVQFSVFLYPYSSSSFEDINESVDPQGLRVSLGIDPNGGTDGDSNSIIWSNPTEYYDEYRELTVSTTALGPSVTVFVRSSVENAPGLHQVFVDDASLIVVGEEPVTPTEETKTPTEETPTEEPTEETETPTEEPPTEEPTEEPTETPTPETVTPVTETPTPERTPYSDEFPNEVVHTVTFGDTVIDLAARYNSTVDAVVEYNGLGPNGLIFVNQTLLIPVPEGQGTPVIPPTATPTPEFGQGGAEVPVTGVHIVQPGENLFRIALRYNTTVDTLAQYNGIVNPSRVFIGQQIRIPTETTTPVEPAPAQPIDPAPAQPIPDYTSPVWTGQYIIHTVQPGENVFRIGLKYNVTVDVVARANGLINPNLIFVGQQLVIPQ
ncbi:MAG: LysM peptidoglycan-binding domain-containing protein [Chloroflexi bacterium]|nr:LysM peptidoglycan-binding domain-containing protein [Chloroflexota bacterium]